MNHCEAETVERCRDKLSLLLETCTANLELEGQALNGAALLLIDVIDDLAGLLK
jgi:hypothetical protein